MTTSKPGGQVLELGTGIGLGSAHLLAGMDGGVRLTTYKAKAQLARNLK